MRALIVDDAPDLRELVRVYLERAGHDVVGEAADGQEAITKAAELQPEWIILDGLMPVMDGFEALPELRRLLPDARIVMFSSVPAAERRAHAGGAAAYVEKPSGLGTLLAALEGRAAD